MIYCMSDLHGERALFEQMLERIRFSDGDRLYIIGDVIDRGPDGVDLLERIMEAPNMTLLLGNHEQMCLSTLGPHSELGARELWPGSWGGRTAAWSPFGRCATGGRPWSAAASCGSCPACRTTSPSR